MKEIFFRVDITFLLLDNFPTNLVHRFAVFSLHCVAQCIYTLNSEVYVAWAYSVYIHFIVSAWTHSANICCQVYDGWAHRAQIHCNVWGLIHLQCTHTLKCLRPGHIVHCIISCYTVHTYTVQCMVSCYTMHPYTMVLYDASWHNAHIHCVVYDDLWYNTPLHCSLWCFVTQCTPTLCSVWCLVTQYTPTLCSVWCLDTVHTYCIVWCLATVYTYTEVYVWTHTVQTYNIVWCLDTQSRHLTPWFTRGCLQIISVTLS